MVRTALVSLLGSSLLAVGALAQQTEPRRFGLDDFSKVAHVSEPQITPDGKSVAVVIGRPSLDEDRYVTDLDVVDVATKATTVLVTGRPELRMPRWSPDGQRMAFLSDVGTGAAAKAQIFVVKRSGGAATGLTTAPLGVQQFAWSPNGQWVAYATADEPEKKAGSERFNISFEVVPGDDFLTNAAKTPTHIWLVASTGGQARRLTSGTWSLPISHPPGSPASFITWTPDGTGVVFDRQGGGGAGAGGGRGGGGVQVVTIADGVIKPLAGVNGSHPQFAPTGTAIATLGRGGVTVLPAPGGQAKTVTQHIDRSLARALWMPDGQTLLVGGNDSTRVGLWLQPVDGAATKVDVGDLSPYSLFWVDMAVGRDGSIAFTASSAMHGIELYYMASATATPKALTNVNAETAAIPLGKTDVIEWTNDNLQENGLLTYPPDFNPSQKYPLVLLIHGGPRYASLLTFSPDVQLMAAKGWLVFQPNYRGSDNLGASYQGAISGDAGDGPGRDVMAGIEEVKKRGIVDESRMAVSGWSYGGYMTTWMIGHYNVWKAAVAGAAVTDEIDQRSLGDGSGGRGGANSVWLNPQAMDRQREQSPITYAAKMKTPTLILSDVGDYRVPIVESYKLFHALLDAGVPTQFFAYPIVGHFPVDPVLERDVQRRWVGWLDQYLNAPPSSTGGK